MKTLGIDIGTTTVSVVVLEDGSVAKSRTVESNAFIPSPYPWEKIQDVDKIINTAFTLVEDVFDDSIEAIGVTGQQHGIVYLDAEGKALGPLYTWQDGRGDLHYRDGQSYADCASAATHRKEASGYGLVTHFYNIENGLVPPHATKICTIHDYIAMCLAGLKEPVTDSSDAASFGFFDVRSGRFDRNALVKLGIDVSILPKIASRAVLGNFRGCPVCIAIGDNQASFIGATGGHDAMLVNVGTGSQFSAMSNEYIQCKGLETRPFPLGGYLLVGAAICGGRAYSLLDGFFCEAVNMVTGTRPDHCYEQMADAIDSIKDSSTLPEFSPLFMGTREDPFLRASLTGLSAVNFTPASVALALLKGMAEELGCMFRHYLEAGGKPLPLYGAGNGIKLNRALRKAVEERFGSSLILSAYREDAAAGAAMFAKLIV